MPPHPCPGDTRSNGFWSSRRLASGKISCDHESHTGIMMSWNELLLINNSLATKLISFAFTSSGTVIVNGKLMSLFVKLFTRHWWVAELHTPVVVQGKECSPGFVSCESTITINYDTDFITVQLDAWWFMYFTCILQLKAAFLVTLHLL
jgi:hypothetical protein